MSASEAVKSFVDGKINSKKVVMFSKTYCPYCTMAKKVLDKYVGKELPVDQYEVVEIENDPRMDEIQNYLKTLTGGRSVPRVFINGKCIGGGDETKALDASGQLKPLLAA